MTLYLFSFLAMQLAVTVLMLASLQRSQIPMVGQYVLSLLFAIIYSCLAHGLLVRIVLVCRARWRTRKERS